MVVNTAFLVTRVSQNSHIRSLLRSCSQNLNGLALLSSIEFSDVMAFNFPDHPDTKLSYTTQSARDRRTLTSFVT